MSTHFVPRAFDTLAVTVVCKFWWCPSQHESILVNHFFHSEISWWFWIIFKINILTFQDIVLRYMYMYFNNWIIEIILNSISNKIEFLKWFTLFSLHLFFFFIENWNKSENLNANWNLTKSKHRNIHGHMEITRSWWDGIVSVG